MLAMWLAWTCLAAEVVVTGPALPGVPMTVEVGGGDPSRMTLTAGAAAVAALQPRGNVARFQVFPDLSADSVELVADVSGQVVRTIERLELPSTASVVVPPRIEVVAEGPVEIPITGDLSNVAVRASEGSAKVVALPDGTFRIAWSPGEGGAARVVLLSAIAEGTDERPAFTAIRLRTRRTLSFVTEPGSTLEVLVGDRRYGPATASESGSVSVVIDQFPGEGRATAILADDLGNATRSDVALGTSGGAVGLVVPLGPVVPGRTAPPLWLQVVRDDGSPWTGARPNCKVPGAELALREIEAGSWFAVLPPRRQVLDELRVSCEVGTGQIDTTLRADASIPDRLALQVFPTDLDADDPTAEVRAVLQDPAGNRLPADGVVLSAARGLVRGSQGLSGVVGGTYDGRGVGAGEDVISAKWTPPPVTGPVGSIDLAWPPVFTASAVPVWARAITTDGRPVVGARIALEVGTNRAEGLTGGDGWFHGVFPVTTNVVVRATAGRRRSAAILGTGDPGLGHPGAALLEASEAVRVRLGRVTGILLTVDPPVLRAGPGSYALVSVRLADRDGYPVEGAPPVLEASAGRFGGVSNRAKGEWVAEWYPDGVANAAQVEVTASVDDVRSSTRLEVAPRSLSPSIMPFVGVLSNLGAVNAAFLGVDVELRFRAGWLGDTFSARLTSGTYGWTDDVETGLGAPLSARSLVVPVAAVAVLRRDFGAFGGEGGLGMATALHRVEARVGARTVSVGSELLAGPYGVVALTRRAGIGEVALSVRGIFLPGLSGDLSWSGNIGGVSSDLGYRLLF